jgi:hypothetical protein
MCPLAYLVHESRSNHVSGRDGAGQTAHYSPIDANMNRAILLCGLEMFVHLWSSGRGRCVFGVNSGGAVLAGGRLVL